MDTFTIILIVVGVALVVTVAVHEIRHWKRPGHHISQNASMDSDNNNIARYTSTTNIHNGGNGFDAGGGL